MNQITRCSALLGTLVEIHIEADISDMSLIHESGRAFEIIRKIHQEMSFHDRSSMLSEINSDAFEKPVEISESMHEVLQFSLNLSKQTNGIFDISVAPQLVKNNFLPKHKIAHNRVCGYQFIELTQKHIFFNKPLLLDLGGVAKGFAVDKAYESILMNIPQKSIKQVYVNAGGDLRYMDWKQQKVYIADNQKNLESQIMQASALATSAGYYSDGQSEIFNPITATRNDIQNSVSVFADTCMHADALTKVLTLDKGIFCKVSREFNAIPLIN